MEKNIRKAVRCFLIEDGKVVVTKYRSNNEKEGYYDIPGGKIEEGELPKQTAIREMKEETGVSIQNLEYKGLMTVEYPDRIYIFETFLVTAYEGTPQNFKENTSEWIEIERLLKQEKILSNIIILNRFFIKGLISNKHKFNMHVVVNNKEEMMSINYKLIDK